LRDVERIKPTDLTAAPGLTAEPIYRALAILGTQYATLHGQKRVIWVTHGIPLTIEGPAGPIDLTPQLKQTAAEFNRLGIALSTVRQSSCGGVGSETLQSLPPSHRRPVVRKRCGWAGHYSGAGGCPRNLSGCVFRAGQNRGRQI